MQFREKLVARLVPTLALAITTATPATAAPQNIIMTGAVLNVCILTVSTPGILATGPSGTELSTTQTGGLAAVLAVVATGTAPTITFTSPAVSGPSSGDAVAAFAYSSPGGASQDFTSSGYTYSMDRLLDTVAINGRATNPTGFASGTYTMSATATCSQ